MPSPIAVRDLRKVYKSQGDRRRQLREVVALDGITFEIERGEFFGLLGPNGAGKTTTIGILTTRVRPTSGLALIEGIDVARDPVAVKRRIGAVPQANNLDRSLTGRENLLFHAEYSPERTQRKGMLNKNNIAWLLRHFPIFGVFGNGQYRLQPIYVDDLAALAVGQGMGNGDRIIDAIGPETFTYRDLVRTISDAIGVRRPVVSVSPAFGYAVGWLIGKLVGDVMITRDEIRGLMQGLLCTNSTPAGKTALTDWARKNAAGLGARYAAELSRRRF